MTTDKKNNHQPLKGGRAEAKDDWEDLVLVLNEMPGLKKRVLHKIRALREELKSIKQKSSG